METLQFPQGVHPNTSEQGMNPHPMAGDPSVTKGTGFADLVLHGPEPPSLWNDLTGILRKVSHCRGADKCFTLLLCTMSVLQGLFQILNWWAASIPSEVTSWLALLLQALAFYRALDMQLWQNWSS